MTPQGNRQARRLLRNAKCLQSDLSGFIAELQEAAAEPDVPILWCEVVRQIDSMSITLKIMLDHAKNVAAQEKSPL